MGIFSRISDIVSANLSDMVEKYEDPEQMLRQAIREMEAAIATSKKDVAKAMANEKLVAKELATNESAAATWTQRAGSAVEMDDDDLARKALERKREHEQVAAALRDQHEAAADAATTLRTQLEAMQAKLSEAQRQLGTLSARKKAADVKARVSQIGQTNDLDQKAFEKFERMRKKVEMAEAEAEAMSELSKDSASASRSDADLAKAGANLDIEAELAALKRNKGS